MFSQIWTYFVKIIYSGFGPRLLDFQWSNFQWSSMEAKFWLQEEEKENGFLAYQILKTRRNSIYELGGKKRDWFHPQICVEATKQEKNKK